MSHKTTIKTSLNNKKYLIEALKKLGFKYKEAENGQLTTKGNYGVHEKVDILIEGNGVINYNDAIGFKLEKDGTYTAVGDFYSLRTSDGRSVTSEMLKCEVTAHSKEAEINERLSALSFEMDQSSVFENNNELNFQMKRWVN